MGELARLAQKNSKFLKIEKGKHVIVQYMGFQTIPNRNNPDLVSIQYKVCLSDGDFKYWENSSSKVMIFFDKLKTGDMVKIMRNPSISDDGKEDLNKSVYLVEKVEA